MAQASQASVSHWEKGIHQPNPASIAKIIEYSTVVSPPAPLSDAEKENKAAEANFEGIVRDITAEPLLGEIQAALVQALIERLRTGPPMSAEDAAASRWLSDLLHLPAQ